MDMQRAQAIIDRYSKQMLSELQSLQKIDQYSKTIAETPYLKQPVNLHHKIENFKFEQKYDPQKAQEAMLWLKSQKL